ncbi:NTF2-like N-terminal transpeptidase domain-containing protein [Methanolobus psychrotolerans]|uniref:NTF2-like N-terminal transpeptidase domain-containing protein n=1 Tax=Methanolobus psychrotolerans TaxID=1874706 RepID=UPI000B91791D|nr:NTF2-like N-terminal transpeptidase domain-containing protein [Methanolobus psychrotolerans]
MRKVIIGTILLAVVLAAGCAGIGSSPSKTVEKFVSQFNEGNYDTCYDLMSSGYRQQTSLPDFVDICKDVNPDKYEFIEVTKEYVDEDNAVVDVLVNESSIAIKFSLKNFIEVEPEFEVTTKQIELVKQEDEWKITDFPYVLT